jgi:hypothetical protein
MAKPEKEKNRLISSEPEEFFAYREPDPDEDVDTGDLRQTSTGPAISVRRYGVGNNASKPEEILRS